MVPLLVPQRPFSSHPVFSAAFCTFTSAFLTRSFAFLAHSSAFLSLSASLCFLFSSLYVFHFSFAPFIFSFTFSIAGNSALVKSLAHGKDLHRIPCRRGCSCRTNVILRIMVVLPLTPAEDQVCLGLTTS